MTSLPMPSGWPDPVPPAPTTAIANCELSRPSGDDERFLLRAFRSFAAAAASLERSYGLLREEVQRLRHELEQANRDLVESLRENRRTRAYLDRVLEGLPCGVLVASGAGEIAKMNPEARRLVEMAREAEPGNAAQPLPPTALASLASLPQAMRELFDQARQTDGEPEIRIGDAERVRWLAARHASIVGGPPDQGPGDRDGTAARHGEGSAAEADGSAAEAASSVFILRDVSAHKLLKEAEARLGRQKALAEVSALLAHEIRNPLGSLELFAGLLADSGLEGEPRHWIEHVQAGLRTLAATVNNVLHIHSLPEPEPSLLDLEDLLDWAGRFLRPLAHQSRITLSTQNRLRGIRLSADRHRLEQVLLNLVLNAVHAMPGGGWIEIGGRVDEGRMNEGRMNEGRMNQGRCVLITVADTGPGISPEHLPQIFEPGFSTRPHSPGLGLAVCRKIVEQHGGEIRAASPPGRGATFTLTFPLREAVPPGAGAPGGAA